MQREPGMIAYLSRDGAVDLHDVDALSVRRVVRQHLEDAHAERVNVHFLVISLSEVRVGCGEQLVGSHDRYVVQQNANAATHYCCYQPANTPLHTFPAP